MTVLNHQELGNAERDRSCRWPTASTSRVMSEAQVLPQVKLTSQVTASQLVLTSCATSKAEGTTQDTSHAEVTSSSSSQPRVTPRPHHQKGRPDVTLLWVASVVLVVLTCALGLADATDDTDEMLPHFLEPIPNKTVVVGRDVILPCSVDNLKGFKVAWIFVETQTILTIHHTIITKNPRFTLARNDHKHWYLKISDVRPSDRGKYMCQVNSDPMMSQTGFLDVQVPPDIIDDESSSEVVVKEGQDVTLECRARGSPKPVISWKREDGGKIDINNGINLKVTDSEVLHIPTVSRLHMGAYLCIASNDVPPSVSKRIILQVQFQPVLWIPNQLVGVAQGMDVTLECHTEAFPRSINYWTDDKSQMILSSGRFDSIVAENGYKAYMRLKIKNVQPEDFMSYRCFAKNSFGETNGSVKVYEIPRQLLVHVPDPKKEEEEEKKEDEEEKEAREHEPQGENHTKNFRRKDPEEEEEEDHNTSGMQFGSFPSLHNHPSSAISSIHTSILNIILVSLCSLLTCLLVARE